MPFKLGVIGIDHGHIFGMLANMKNEGCTCDAYWTDGPAVTETKFNEVEDGIGHWVLLTATLGGTLSGMETLLATPRLGHPPQGLLNDVSLGSRR